jgi:hypothetical protein
VLDLSPLLPLLLREFAQRRITLPEGVTLRPEDLQITLFDGHVADRVRQLAHRVDTAAWAFLVAMLVSLVLSVALAAERVAALERAGFGLAIAMVILIALLVVFPNWFASSVETGGAVVADILEAISQSLRVTAVSLAFVGLVLGSAFAGLRALRRGTTPRGAALE